VRRRRSPLADVIGHIEHALHGNGWAVRLLRALGIRPTVQTTAYLLAGSDGQARTPPLRVAYASDFHAGPTTDPAVVTAACAALRAVRPDVLLLGGDFVNFKREDIDWLAPELATIPAALGRFAVLGNHDWIAGPRYVTDALERAGISVLTNRNSRLPKPFDDVWICGLDDHWYGYPDAEAAFAGATGARLLLMHAPSGLLDAGTNRFDVAFCGHTHGGQIALPDGRPLAVPNGALSRRYSRGRYALPRGGTLIVSTGVGCVVLPLRIYADPEVVVCTIGAQGEAVGHQADG
jgi:predicted MPP superfamily phosphohydrolase